MSGEWNVERGLLIATFIASVLAFTFGVGVNWARLTSQEATIRSIQESMISREVYQADQRYLADSIDRLTRTLERLQAETNGQRMTPAP